MPWGRSLKGAEMADGWMSGHILVTLMQAKVPGSMWSNQYGRYRCHHYGTGDPRTQGRIASWRSARWTETGFL